MTLYRVTQVRTPEGKNIYYTYDGYGRQIKRITPDAGTTDFVYDKNNNLTYSQDSNQRNLSGLKYTFRNYDGLNRLAGIGERIFDADAPSDGSQSNESNQSYYLTVNVYDTISHSLISNFFTGVSGYTTSLNYTKGNLAATAYRTRSSDSWNFKYYRYDVRGRVIKLWNIISGFDTLVTEYQYNSQDQVINYTHKGSGNFKRFRNIYDYTGRLYQVDHFYEPGEEDNPEYYANLLEYTYNENSQTDVLKFNVEMENEYFYNNRNWITAMISNKTSFDYTNTYFRNGNVKTKQYSGEYNKNFAYSSDLSFTYEYDRSNRLLEAVTQDNKFEITNSYDKDGNILTLDRKGSAGSSVDDFNYSYYNGTNKISRVQSSKEQFVYDYNGNLITDSLNSNFSIHYDHRNLITDLIQRVIEVSAITPADTSFYKTYYYYDEAGNRTRKKAYNDENDSLLKDIVYLRDVSGKEMAIYENGSLKQWNIYGTDNSGFINANGDKRFYLKDHLGSVRAVIDDGGSIISSQDYDAWGYQLQDRNFISDVSIYKFTCKERDEENKYDYFGVRYYDARVGRWGQVEPLLDDFPQFTPYNYSLNNPIRLLDDDGNGPKDGIKLVTTAADIKASFNEIIERVSLGYEKISSGDFSGAFQQMTENIIESPRLLGGLIPGDFTTDFVMPLGMVRGSGNLLKLTEGLSLKDQANEIKSFIGKNRVTMPEGTLDLVGRSHGGVETPHFKPLIFQSHKGEFFPKTFQKLTRNATKEDLNKAVNFINKVLKVDAELIKSNF